MVVEAVVRKGWEELEENTTIFHYKSNQDLHIINCHDNTVSVFPNFKNLSSYGTHNLVY